jgi:hypothetical protein
VSVPCFAQISDAGVTSPVAVLLLVCSVRKDIVLFEIIHRRHSDLKKKVSSNHCGQSLIHIFYADL